MMFYCTHLSHVHIFNVSSEYNYNTYYYAHKQVTARARYQFILKMLETYYIGSLADGFYFLS